MRIGTWNVEYAYPKRLDVLRRVMDQYRADIWVLTETHDDLVPAGCEHFAHSLPRPKNFSAIRPESRWVSIWSRYPIIECVLWPDDDGERAVTENSERTVTAILDIGEGRKLMIYGTVMPWPADRLRFGLVVPLQCKEWAELQSMHPDALLCVAGDYNTDMGSGPRSGTKEGMAALLTGLCDCKLFCATTPGRVPSGLLPVLPIDHISLPLAWAKSASVVAAWPAFKGITSDHSGLIVEVDDAA